MPRLSAFSFHKAELVMECRVAVLLRPNQTDFQVLMLVERKFTVENETRNPRYEEGPPSAA